MWQLLALLLQEVGQQEVAGNGKLDAAATVAQHGYDGI